MYKHLPEDNIAEKIIKLRKQHNLHTKEFAKCINHHWSSIKAWENEGVMPKPSSIYDICTKFNVSLKYFDDYYYYYFNKPGAILKAWKERNGYSYTYCSKLLDISDSGIKRLAADKLNLSYDMYLKFKKLKIFK